MIRQKRISKNKARVNKIKNKHTKIKRKIVLARGPSVGTRDNVRAAGSIFKPRIMFGLWPWRRVSERGDVCALPVAHARLGPVRGVEVLREGTGDGEEYGFDEFGGCREAGGGEDGRKRMGARESKA